MQILNCTGCGRYAEFREDVKSYTCGTCNIVGTARVQHAEEERLSVYTPEQSVAARKAKKPWWRQSDLASHLGISVAHITQFEAGHALIDPKHAAWLDKQ